jgi:hypothetical protein
MHDREKSHSAIVAAKPTNKAGAPAAEPVEPRAGTKRNAGGQSTHRTQGWVRVTQALERVRQAARLRKDEKFALPPLQRGSVPGGVLRAQTRCRTRRGRADVGDLCNTVHLYRRLPAGRAGARPRGANQRQSCMRDRRANPACGSGSAFIPHLVIDDRGYWLPLACSPTLLTGIKSP